MFLNERAGIACWWWYRTRDRKVSSSNPGRSGGSIFFSRVNFVCLLLFGVRSTPVLPRWHVKDPGHSAESACDRLHLNMHTSLTQRSRSGLTMPLCRHSAGTYQETSPPPPTLTKRAHVLANHAWCKNDASCITTVKIRRHIRQHFLNSRRAVNYITILKFVTPFSTPKHTNTNNIFDSTQN